MKKQAFWAITILTSSTNVCNGSKVISLPLKMTEVQSINPARMTSARSLFAQVVPRSNHTQRLTPFSMNIFIETDLLLGSQQQPLNVVIDTGSSWTWALTDECDDIDDCPNESAFHYLLSDTFQLTDETKSITYGDRVTEGLICSDNVGTEASEDLIVANFPMIKVTDVQDEDDIFSGIVGLSPKDDSAGPLFVDYLF